MGAADFPPAFIAISLLAASAALVFFQLKPDAGEELTGRKLVQAKEATLRTPEPASEQV
jgi:hypothetical protein